MADDEPITDQEKVKIASNFIVHAPPGEFNEVFNDVRILLDDDKLLKEGASGAFSKYNKDQFTPCKVEGSEHQVLVTEHGDQGSGRFIDPRTKKSFKYDHLRKEGSDFQTSNPDPKAESWRSAIEASMTNYINNHYKIKDKSGNERCGVVTVYGSSSGGNITIIACIESHRFEHKNYSNGRLRSQWSVTFPESGGKAELTGVLKVQVHYYEDGNVQLVSSKEIKQTLNVTNEQQTAKDIANLISDSEAEYQKAVTENYDTMSETTFKALRRRLPVTREKINWNNIMGYKMSSGIKNQ